MVVGLGRLYTSKEAKEYWHISQATFNRWIKSGQITGQKVGARWRFTEEQLKQFAGQAEAAEQGER